MFRTATFLGLTVSPSISDNALRNLINRQPATEAQVRFLERFLRPLMKTPPPGMTYGQAVEAIKHVREDGNQYTIEAMRLEEGMVLFWEGAYYCIVKVHGQYYNYRINLQQVVLTRQPGDVRASMFATDAREFWINPSDLLYLCIVVDLTAWWPYDGSPSSETDIDF